VPTPVADTDVVTVEELNEEENTDNGWE
jgi:hypothetical protein